MADAYSIALGSEHIVVVNGITKEPQPCPMSDIYGLWFTITDEVGEPICDRDDALVWAFDRFVAGSPRSLTIWHLVEKHIGPKFTRGLLDDPDGCVFRVRIGQSGAVEEYLEFLGVVKVLGITGEESAAWHYLAGIEEREVA